MAEVKEENVRDVYRSTLEQIIEKIIRQKEKYFPNANIQIKEGRSIGVFTYKRKGNLKTQKLYSITMVAEGSMFTFLFGEDGDRIAKVEEREEQEEENGRRTVAQKVTIEPDDNIELDERMLKETMSLSKDFQNDNQGRYITDRNERIILSDGEKREQKMNIEGKTELPNLAEINVKINSSVAIIDLYRTIYNGRRLSDVLGIDQELKDRLPNGINIEHLNFLTVVNSDQLTAKDGKKRESDVTCVIMDDPRNPKQMIELDSSILEPMDNISNSDKVEADKDSQILGDGKIKKRAETTTRMRNITTFKIKRGAKEISQPDDELTLDIRYNPKTIDESTSQRNDATDIEIYLGRLPANASQHSQKFKKDQNDNDNNFYQLVKLEDYKEVRAIDEISMQYLFRNDFGVKDEDENIKGVSSGEGMEVPERDANALNRQMAKEEQEHNKKLNLQTANEGNITAEISNSVDDVYRKMAQSIEKSIGMYSEDEIYEKILSIKSEYEKNNIQLSLKELKNKAEQDLYSERFLGDSFNSRRPA